MQNFDQAVGNKTASEGKTVVSGFVKQLTQTKANKKELQKWASIEEEMSDVNMQQMSEEKKE